MLLLFLPLDGTRPVRLESPPSAGFSEELGLPNGIYDGVSEGASEAENDDGVLGTGDDETDVGAEGVMTCGELDPVEGEEGDMAIGDDVTEGAVGDTTTGEGVMTAEGDVAFRVGAGDMPETTDGDIVLGVVVPEGEDAKVAVGATGEGYPVVFSPGTVVAPSQQIWLNTVVNAWHAAVLEIYGTKAAPS